MKTLQILLPHYMPNLQNVNANFLKMFFLGKSDCIDRTDKSLFLSALLSELIRKSAAIHTWPFTAEFEITIGHLSLTTGRRKFDTLDQRIISFNR